MNIYIILDPGRILHYWYHQVFWLMTETAKYDSVHQPQSLFWCSSSRLYMKANDTEQW